MKNLFIAEKPSVAAEFARALNVSGKRQNGYIESDSCVVTWCVGHLVTMSYPDKYDTKLKKWSLDTLPFLPSQFRYEVIEDVKSQFLTVKKLLNREDVGCIYICTDSGREGEYIYRLVDEMAGVKDKERRRVWIDSQTEEEIKRGIQNAKDWSEYDSLSASAYLRAKEDYLMGINFSRVLTLKYGMTLSGLLKRDRTVLSVGRVMTCVLGMTVRREREIRDFKKIPFYRVMAHFRFDKYDFKGEWRAVKSSAFYGSPKLYKENGFKTEDDAMELIGQLGADALNQKENSGDGDLTAEKSNRLFAYDGKAEVVKAEKKKDIKNPPLLYNLAEIQNECSKRFKISPDETLKIIQGLYESKLVTYPRTDARVLSSAVAKEISRNISGLKNLESVGKFAGEIIENKLYEGIGKSRYTNDSQITDHYAIIPTGQGLGTLNRINPLHLRVYDMICRRFLSIFYPPAVYERYAVEAAVEKEHFFTTFRLLKDKGYLKVAYPDNGKNESQQAGMESDTRSSHDTEKNTENDSVTGDVSEAEINDPEFARTVGKLKKGSTLNISAFSIREGETSPPKRYTSGSMILAMENAGKLIEDEELRSQIKSCGIGTSATRAEILKKLVSNTYLSLNKKTQVITPTLLGEMVYEVVYFSVPPLLNPDLTASWEKGLNYVAQGTITTDEYMMKLERFVGGKTNAAKLTNNQTLLREAFEKVRENYRMEYGSKNSKKTFKRRTAATGKSAG